MKNTAKKILISGLLLALGGCSSSKFKEADCYQDNAATFQFSETSTSSSQKKYSPKTLIVLSPHFDDAALSAGGNLSKFDGTKYIVTFFSTPATTTQYLTHWDEMCGFKKSTDAKEIREQENVNAANILGAEIINLNYVDNQYEIRSPSDISDLIEAITQDI